jgi:hypothetical protein
MAEKTGICVGRAVEGGGGRHWSSFHSSADFQVMVAAAKAWELIGHIKIIEIREENRTAPAAAIRL